MQANPKVQERPDVSAAERTSHELVMRILKLRWMGMENEPVRCGSCCVASIRNAPCWRACPMRIRPTTILKHVRSRSIGERIITCLRRADGQQSPSAPARTLASSSTALR